MDAVTIFLAKALICFQGVCHPVLLGENTHPGTYDMNVLLTDQRGYGGDVLMYDSDDRQWYGVHRTYNNLPARERLYSRDAEARRYVTNGCPNVQPEVYEQLRDCCRNLPLVIED